MGRQYDPRIHHRRSIRLQGYDYATPGAYFVTICIQNQECLLGAVVNGEMVLNAAGQMVQRVWDELPAQYPGVETDAFVVMPNHVHGIVVLIGDVGDAGHFGQAHGHRQHGQAQGPAPTTNAMDDDAQARNAMDENIPHPAPPMMMYGQVPVPAHPMPAHPMPAPRCRPIFTARRDTALQILHHRVIRTRRAGIRVASLSRAAVAAQLLGTHHTRRCLIAPHPALHRKQSTNMVTGPTPPRRTTPTPASTLTHPQTP